MRDLPTKLGKHVARGLLLVGVALLGFCAVAKLHEIVWSRLALRHFENLRRAAVDLHANAQPVFARAVRAPDFVLWSEDRIKHYEESLSVHVAAPLAVIHIDRLHVEAPVFEGTDDLTLNRGVGHVRGTARVGAVGNVALAGHRDGFFRGLKDIKIGDRIDLEEPGQTETYMVDRLDIVSPHYIGVLRPSNKPVLTLITCYPFYYLGSAPQRFIVHAVPARFDIQTVSVTANRSDGSHSLGN